MIREFLGRQAFKILWNHLEGKIDAGSLNVSLPNGPYYHVEGKDTGPRAELVLKSYIPVWRILQSGSLGFAEAYMVGECDSPNLRHVLDFTLANPRWYNTPMFNSKGMVNWLARFRHRQRDNSQKGSRKNISYHYDLGNSFYALWLDPSMTYSAGIFAEGMESLEDAQNEKYRRLADRLNLKPGMRVLEIGCGWGGFATFAAQNYSVHVTGLTLSHEQLDYGLAKVRELGLDDAIDLHFCDYREHTGRDYDALVSIEMFEAVGERYWQTYFEQLEAFLKPGGKAALQVITIEAESYEAYRQNPDFIQKYIFPGGMLPTSERLRDLAQSVDLWLDNMVGYHEDYVKTLEIWLETFQAQWPAVATLSAAKQFDERFKRMWEYYLTYCAAGFASSRLDVKQMSLYKNPISLDLT